MPHVLPPLPRSDCAPTPPSQAAAEREERGLVEMFEDLGRSLSPLDFLEWPV
jgi:hypothetical protein